MKRLIQTPWRIIAVGAFVVFLLAIAGLRPVEVQLVEAQAVPAASATPQPVFDQKAALYASSRGFAGLPPAHAGGFMLSLATRAWTARLEPFRHRSVKG